MGTLATPRASTTRFGMVVWGRTVSISLPVAEQLCRDLLQSEGQSLLIQSLFSLMGPLKDLCTLFVPHSVFLIYD